MKTTILATAVLIALGSNAHALEVEFSDTKVEATEVVSATDTDKARKDEEKVKAAAKAKAEADSDVKAKAKKDAEEKAKADADAKKSAAAKSDSKADDEKPRKKITGFQDNNGVTGDLEVGIVGNETVLKFTPDSCSSGSCTKVVLFHNKNLSDMTALRDALGNPPKPVDTEDKEDSILSSAEKKRLERKREKETTDVTDKDVRDELALMLSTECGIDEEVVSSGRSLRNSRSSQNLEAALGKTRFSGLEVPEKSSDSNSSDQFKSDAECSAGVLKEFMAEHEAEDLTDLKEKLNDLKTAQKEWKLDLRREDSESGRKRIQKKLDAVSAEIAKVTKELDSAKKTASAYDKATLNVAKRLIIAPAVSDLATRKFFTSEDFFLHDLAATTSDTFKGVRKAASNSLLDIYRLQSQSYLAFNEMANKTNDPAQKLHMQQTALHYQQAGMNYNSMMNNIKFKGELGHSAAQAGLQPKSILEEIYGNYNSGSQEITNYLSSTSATSGATRPGANQALPQVLMVQNNDGTYSQVTVDSTTVGPNGTSVVSGTNGRGQRVQLNTNGIRGVNGQPLLNSNGQAQIRPSLQNSLQPIPVQGYQQGYQQQPIGQQGFQQQQFQSMQPAITTPPARRR